MPGPVKPILPPFEPMLCPAAIKKFDELLTKDMLVFEWGSGASTLWLAERCKYVDSIEHNHDWFVAVLEAALKADTKRALIKWASDVSAFSLAITTYPDEHFDLVFVDGLDRTRVECVRQAMPKVKRGGWLVLDDSHWRKLRPAWRLLKDWENIVIDGEKMDYRKKKMVPTQTTFFRRPECE